MIRESIPYVTHEQWLASRKRDLTSTDIAALWGLSPYLTPFELHFRKHGDEGFEFEPVENERVTWGIRLQNVIGSGVCDDNGWDGAPFTDYVRLPEHRVGASFDWKVIVDGEPRLMEIKNVDSLTFRNEWTETDYGLEAPSHIEAQLQTQLLVSGLKEGYIAALIGGNRIELLHRTYDEVIGQRILDEAAKFWAQTEPPAPDFHRDGKLIARLYGHAEEGKVIEADERILALLRRYDEQGRIKRVADDEQQAAKAELLTLIGDAEKVVSDEFTVSAKTVAPTEVAAFTRQGFRNLRVYQRKQK